MNDGVVKDKYNVAYAYAHWLPPKQRREFAAWYAKSDYWDDPAEAIGDALTED